MFVSIFSFLIKQNIKLNEDLASLDNHFQQENICDNIPDLLDHFDKMAKLCSLFSTSPITSFFNELSPNAFSEDFNQIQPDPFDYLDELPSIYSDIQKIQSDSLSPFGCSSPMDLDLDIKPEIRNTDLMWCTHGSDNTNTLSTSASSMCSDISTGVPLAAVMGVSTNHHANVKIEKNSVTQHQQKPQRQQSPTVVMARRAQPTTFKQENIDDIKQEPTDDVEQQLAHHSIPNNKTTLQKINGCTILTTTTTATMQNIPPGTSLLRKSQQQQQQQQQLKKSSQQQKQQQQQLRGTIPMTKRGDQLLPSANAMLNTDSSTNNNSSSLFNTIYQRPDTPHSLDDDCSSPVFRHNVDLRACVMGSNNISLTANPEDFISNVSQELQDTSKQQIDTRLISTCSLADVLDVINSSTTNSEESTMLKSNSVISSCSSGVYSYPRSSESDSDEESLIGSSNSSLYVSSQSSNSSSTQHYMQHRDHSYTRCKDGMDDLSTNLETPSDSGELVKSNFFPSVFLLYLNIIFF